MSLDFLDSVAEKVAEARVQFSPLVSAKAGNSIINLSPLLIDAWEYRDRQEFEIGDINSLAESIKLKGQAQPIVLVEKSNIFGPKSNPDAEYIVIAGYRRWLACKSINIDIEAVVKELSFESAIACLIAENEKQPVSDFSRGMFFSSLLKREGTNKKVIYDRLGLTKSVFNNYLSFSEVPNEVWEAVGDVSKVSSRSAGVIKNICKKGDSYIDAIISISGKISQGYAEMKIQKEVDKYIALLISVSKDDTTVSLSKSIKITNKKNAVSINFQKLSIELKDEFEKGLSDYVEKFISKNEL